MKTTHLTPRPPLHRSGEGEVDIVILGAGIVGAACAWYLAEGGMKVRVVDPNPPGLGTTASGMGHLVAMDDSDQQLAFTAESLRLWREVLPAIDCEADSCGTIWVATDDEELAACRDKAETHERFGIPTEILDERALREAEPHLRPGLAGGLSVPGDGVIYAPKAVAGLLQHPRISTTREDPGGGPRVVAMGCWSPEVLPGLPIRPRKGHLAITDRYPGLVRHQLVELGYLKSAYGDTCRSSIAFNLQPRPTGQVLVGSSRGFSGWDTGVSRSVLDDMLRCAATWLPRLGGANVIRTWAGLRPATPDHMPFIGRWDKDLWVAAGHEGLGITTATATGHLLADLILERKPLLDPAPFDPHRKVDWGD